MGRAGRLRHRDPDRQTARALLRHEHEIGRSVLGRPIIALEFEPAGYARPRPPAVLFGAIHGDEPLGVHCLVELAKDLIERPPGRPTWLIPAINPDGVEAGTKNNAHDVDLNRNFASANWVADHKPGYHPGASAECEPETRALVELIERAGATRLVAIHSPFEVVNWDGAGQALAEEMSRLCGYPATADIGYPTPGSFGSKYGVDRGCEVITLEIPFVTPAEAWAQTRGALRFAVDLPA